MKVIILCGGQGTRLREETEYRPKPMVPIGDHPILWHIMKHYAHYGHNDFHLALGYKGEIIKNYFSQYFISSRDATINLKTGNIETHNGSIEDWLVHLIDTGSTTNTGGRVLRLEPHLKSEPFLLSYGDGVSDVDINAVIDFHRQHKKIVTLTAVRPPARFGALHIEGHEVINFTEKPHGGDGWVNAGFMVIEPSFFKYLEGDETGLEVLQKVAEDGEAAAYHHHGYWQCMDTIRDKEALETEWNTGSPSWKVW